MGLCQFLDEPTAAIIADRERLVGSIWTSAYELDIPAGDAAWRTSASYTLPKGVTVVGVVPDDLEKPTQREVDLQCRFGKHVCTCMPKAMYGKIDGCDHQFFLPAPCAVHRLTGHNNSCLNCISAVQPGVFAAKPFARNFKYYYDAAAKSTYVQE